MPWKECHVMDERLRFVARLLEGRRLRPSPCTASTQLAEQSEFFLQHRRDVVANPAPLALPSGLYNP